MAVNQTKFHVVITVESGVHKREFDKIDYHYFYYCTYYYYYVTQLEGTLLIDEEGTYFIITTVAGNKLRFAIINKVVTREVHHTACNQ